MLKRLVILFSVGALGVFSACTTQQDLRRDQEVERLKQELKEVKGNKVDADVVGEDLKTEINKLSQQHEEQTHVLKMQLEEMKKEVVVLQTRIHTLENQPKPQTDERQGRNVTDGETPRASYSAAKRLYDDAKFGEAAEMLRNLLKGKLSVEDAKKAHFLLAESYFADKEFASAALEYSEFKKNYSKDALVPSAIYRQANSFKAMGKSKEARLFYQELIDRFPKNQWAGKAKNEMKRLTSATKTGKRHPNQVDDEE
jgi:TolA-binding protein